MTSRRMIAGFALLMAILAAVYYAFPSWHIVTWTTIGVASAAAVAVGAVRNRPRHRLPWLLLSAAVLAFTLGDTTYLVLTDVLGQDAPFPSLADVVYLALFFPLASAGLLALTRSGAAARDRESLVDALALTVGFGLLTWMFLVDPYVRADDLTPLPKGISIAYPLYDVLVLAIVARLVIALRHSPSVLLLTAGWVNLLAADVLYGSSRLGLGADWLMGGPIDLGWIIFYAAMGLAALHPSMAAITDPRAQARPGFRVRRVALLTLSSLVAPVVLLIEPSRAAAVVAAVMFLLVLARLYGAVYVYRGAVSRERALREAGAALVSASEPDDVTAAVRAAVARLLPSGTEHRVVLTLDTPPGASPDPGAPRTTFVYTSTLDEPVARQLGGIQVTAKCRLVVANRASGDPHVGTLYVAAAEAALSTLQEAMVVLASQAALAMERIALTGEVTRRRSEEYFRTLVHNSADVILIVDADDRIRYASPSAVPMFGADGLVGARLYDVIEPRYRRVAGRVLDLIRTGDRRATQDDWVVVDGDGALIDVEASCRDLRADPTVAGLVVTLRDVTERRRLERELTHRAFHDSLTGLPNRVLFQDRVQQALARAERNGTVVGVLFIDLDDFKVVNDTMGHAAGDELLVAVSKRLAGALRTGDSAARLGGDEFAALVEDAQDPRDVELVAARLVAAFAEPHVVAASIVNGAASVGVATTADAHDGEDLLRQADLALYVAKGEGKGQWRRYQAALHNAFLERLELRAELDKAVARESFVLHYQPIVALDTGRAAGLEALVRWEHPDRGVLTPGHFITVAEESGLIVPIGNWVLAQALRDAAVLWRTLPAGAAPYVSVNVSARQFRDAGFVASVRRHLDSAGLPPDLLVLEITESLLLRDDDQLRHDLAELREIGVRVAIDDFGTGYSSLSYLRQVPADIIKIEKSFVDTVSVQHQQRALVEGILRLAHTLELAVVAEGIEQVADRDVLAEAGCAYGQGFLFCRPLSLPDVMNWLVGARQVAA